LTIIESFARERTIQQNRQQALQKDQELTSEIFPLSDARKELLQELLDAQNTENQIRLNVSGKTFVTKKTLNNVDSMLKRMINSDFPIDKDENGSILLNDIASEHFDIILEHLRTNSTTHIGLWESLSVESGLYLENLLVTSDYLNTSKLSDKIHIILDEIKWKQEAPLVETCKREFRTVPNIPSIPIDYNWIEKIKYGTLSKKVSIEKYLDNI